MTNDGMYRYWPFFVLVFLAIYGVSFTDRYDFSLIVKDFHALHPDAERQFLHSSPFTFLLGATLVKIGIPQMVAYAVICMGGFAAFYFAFERYLRQTEAREDIAAVVLSTPILLTLTYWVGKSDAYLLAFYLCVLHTRSGGVKFLSGLAMVACHRDISAIMLMTHCLVRRRLDPIFISSVILGQAGVLFYHYGILPQAPASRVNFALANMGLLARNAVNPIAHVVLTFSWGWIFVAQYFLKTKQPIYVAVAIGACLAPALLTLDYTRVFVLCAFPVIIRVAEETSESVRALRAGRFGALFPSIFLLQFHLIYGDRVSDLNWTSFLLRL